MSPNLDHHQWKLIFNAVRKRQQAQIVSSHDYNELGAILDEIYPYAYSETYGEENTR